MVNLEDYSEWDSRTSTLTFNTFRPSVNAPDGSTSVVAPNGSYMRHNGRTRSDYEYLQTSVFNNHLVSPTVANKRSLMQQLRAAGGVGAPDYEMVDENAHCYQSAQRPAIPPPTLPSTGGLRRTPQMGRSTFAAYAYSEQILAVTLTPDENRVGFAMCGGKEADQSPAVVNNIIKGSPADRAGLSIGDEIIEVNGLNVEKSSHPEIVHHIHQCIKSRTIQLRIRRREDHEIGQSWDSNEKERITDAYMVSVDKDNQKKLEKTLHESYPGINTYDMESIHQHFTNLEPLTNGHSNVSHAAIDVDINQNSSQDPWVSQNDMEKQQSSGHHHFGEHVRRVQVNGAHTANDERLESLKKYEDGLKKRQAIATQQQREQEFLRTSLRGSKKLQALQVAEAPPPHCFQNDGYQITPIVEQQHHGRLSAVSTSNGDGATTIELNAVLGSVSRVADSLDAQLGKPQESEFLRSLFDKDDVRTAAAAAAADRRQLSADAAANTTTTDSNTNTNESSHSHQPSTSSSAQPTHPVEALGLQETSLVGNLNNGLMNEKLKMVKLYKSEDSFLGATVRNDGERVVIGRLVKGGVADKSLQLRIGDELLEVNGVDLRAKSVGEVCDILRQMRGDIQLVVWPNQEMETEIDATNDKLPNGRAAPYNTVQHMRALFNYDPEDDYYVPCKELAIKFQTGDILHVISTSDDNWWQAYREGDDPSSTLAGIIPSIHFQTQKELYRRETMAKSDPNRNERNESPSRLLCAKMPKGSVGRKSAKTTHLGSATAQRQPQTNEDFNDESEVYTYEEVSLYLCRQDRKRPVVLVGPPNVGCLELRHKLMEADKEKFCGVVPHTTRPRRQAEQDGVHYHFVTKQKFIDDSKSGKFVEWGEFEKHYYGTSFDAIAKVIERGKTCLLTLKAESLRALRASNLMPYVVFIAPPSLSKLKCQRSHQGQLNVREEDLKAIIYEGKRIENDFGHLFDKVIVNIDLERSFVELRNVIHRVETEPQWVPSTWINEGVSSLSGRIGRR